MIIKSLKNINDLIFNLYKKNKIIILGLLIILIIILSLRFYSNKEGLCMQGCQRPKQILTDTSQPDYLKNGIPLSNCKIYKNGFMDCPWTCSLKEITNNDAPVYNPTSLPEFKDNMDWVNKNILPQKYSNINMFYDSIASTFNMKIMPSTFQSGLDAIKKQFSDKYHFDSDFNKENSVCKKDMDCSSCTPTVILTK
jgi:hypothetical protein